ncbi:DUF4230 domain-containing protein [Candidatus Falkowbacteria bacterium]|nr:DUF4230 domain-containing protein [Candidatus Falkowbacteria bacterium]
MKKIFTYAGVAVVILALGIVAGWWGTKRIAEPRVTSQVILSALRDRGFLVTQTFVFNEAIKITSDSDSFWRQMLWGQAIKAYGIAEVNLGVDLAKLGEEDVKVETEKVTVTIPAVEIFNSRIVGDINLENKQGILKRIFENDDGYNQAVTEMIKQAEANATTAEMLANANQKAQEEIQRLVEFIAKDKIVEVVVRENKEQ